MTTTGFPAPTRRDRAGLVGVVDGEAAMTLEGGYTYLVVNPGTLSTSVM